jgi:proteasome lid subunit RPN8/RPN11
MAGLSAKNLNPDFSAKSHPTPCPDPSQKDRHQGFSQKILAAQAMP